jgi:hypothetical protein
MAARYALAALLTTVTAAAGLGACGTEEHVGESSPDAGKDGPGAVKVGAKVVNCPTVDELGISPSELDVGAGGFAMVSASASVPLGKPPTYAWSATSGVFGNRVMPTTTFACTQAGIVTITVTASFDGCSNTADGVITCLDVDAAL